MEIITHIDQVLPHIGEFGLFQILCLSILCLITIPCTFQALITYFIAYNPAWKCKANSTLCKIDGAIQSTSVDYNFRCKIGRNHWEYTEADDFSVVTQFDLSCEREHLMFITTSMFFVGMALGSIGIGFLGDKYGRSKIMKPSTVLCFLIAFCSAFSPYYWVFAFSRFILGCLAPGTIVMFFVVASEMVGPRYRPFAGIILWMFFTLGLVILGLVAMATKSWKMLMIYSTAPYMILLPFVFFLPESLRWLYVNNRLQDCEKVVTRISLTNGRKQRNIHLTPPKNSQHSVNPMLLFSSKRVFLKSINLGFGWMVSGLAYYGVTLAAKDLTGDYHRDFILSSLVEFPAGIMAIDFATRFGRKRTTQIPLLLGGLFVMAVCAINENTTNKKLLITRLFLGLTGKFFLTLSYDVLYTWTVELYPTQIRSEAIGYVQITSRVGAMASPWVAEWLRVVHWRVPFIVMGLLAVVASVLYQFLPDTKDTKTAEFLETDVRDAGKFEIGSGKKSRDGQKLSLVKEEDELENIA